GIADLEKQIFQQREQYAANEKSIDQARQARQQMSRSGVGGLVDAYKEGGIAAGGIGAIAGAILAGGKLANHMAGFDIRMEQARGSAIAGSIGTDYGN